MNVVTKNNALLWFLILKNKKHFDLGQIHIDCISNSFNQIEKFYFNLIISNLMLTEQYKLKYK